MGNPLHSESQVPMRVQPTHHDQFHDAPVHGKNEFPLRRRMGNYNDGYNVFQFQHQDHRWFVFRIKALLL